MRAKNQLRFVRLVKPREGLINLFHHRFQINSVRVEVLDAIDSHVILKQSPPLIHTAAGRRAGVLRIKRQENHFVALGTEQMIDRLECKRMLVEYRDAESCIVLYKILLKVLYA